MATWIALFRGINVGGRNRLAMADLVATLESAGFSDVRTYIQSGNAVFNARGGTPTSLAARISAAVQRAHGLQPKVLVLNRTALAQAVTANPFPHALAQPGSLHLCFLLGKLAASDLASLARVRTGKEEFALAGRVLYLHTPAGFGSSRLAASTERLLKVDITARNWSTVSALLRMSGG